MKSLLLDVASQNGSEGRHSFCRGAIPNSPQRISSHKGAMKRPASFQFSCASNFRLLSDCGLFEVFRLLFWSCLTTTLSSVGLGLHCFHDMLFPPNAGSTAIRGSPTGTDPSLEPESPAGADVGNVSSRQGPFVIPNKTERLLA